jgi:23S rRNA pseudouridine1911/1915/1917 synthase
MNDGPDAQIPILYEDNHILVVQKPVNMPTQEDASGDLDLLSALKEDIKVRYNKPGNVYLGLVHRLDRPVGGAMLFAKTSKAASRLSDQVRTRSFKKTYWAVLRGKAPKQTDRLRHYLFKNTATNTVSAVDRHHPEAKEAILDYKVKQYLPEHDMTLVEIQLLTGRPHQIRVQFADIGCPLYGDQKYGAAVNKPGQQIALWSIKIGIEHPTLKDALEFHSSPPSEIPWTFWKEG